MAHTKLRQSYYQAEHRLLDCMHMWSGNFHHVDDPTMGQNISSTQSGLG